MGVFFLLAAVLVGVVAINSKNITFNPNKRAETVYFTPTPSPAYGSLPNDYPCGDQCYSACESGTGLDGICRSCDYYNMHKRSSQPAVECPPPWENGYKCGSDCCGGWCYSNCESGTALKGVCVSCQYYNKYKSRSSPAIECAPPYENGDECRGDCYENCKSGLGIKGICRSCEYYNSHSNIPVECPYK